MYLIFALSEPTSPFVQAENMEIIWIDNFVCFLNYLNCCIYVQLFLYGAKVYAPICSFYYFCWLVRLKSCFGSAMGAWEIKTCYGILIIVFQILCLGKASHRGDPWQESSDGSSIRTVFYPCTSQGAGGHWSRVGFPLPPCLWLQTRTHLEESPVTELCSCGVTRDDRKPRAGWPHCPRMVVLFWSTAHRLRTECWRAPTSALGSRFPVKANVQSTALHIKNMHWNIYLIEKCVCI